MTPLMYDLLVRDADLIVTMDGDDVPGGWIAVSGGKVAAVGTPGTEPAAAKTLSAKGSLVTPGLVNTHQHLFQNLTRGNAAAMNVDLFDWLKALYPMWAGLDEEAIEVSTYVGLAELALGGCTTSMDMLYVHTGPNFIDAQVRAAQEVGLRFHATRGSMSLSQKDGGLAPDSVVQTADEILADSERLVSKYHDRSAGAMVQIGLAPCALALVTPSLMRETAELAERLDVRLHTHLSEVQAEDEYCARVFGKRPVEVFEDVGWGTDRAWVAHCVFPNAAEIERLGRWGTGVAHCPTPTLMRGAGPTPVPELRAAGVPVGIGCDSSTHSAHASMWLEAHTALVALKGRGGAGAISARDVLEMATTGSAACLGRSDLGRIRVGAPADLVAWDLNPVAFAGAHSDAVEAWLRCGPVHARHTIVAGNPVVESGELRLPRLPEMLEHHHRISRRLQGLTA
ncbi:amidohydrolase family protein [Amycolatopsis jejuensis]|uniref:amidohydrolase family protein n=1 Tax=Amycolatopsis jejuensis TaxID=330084 RepID=UPI000524CE8C|nr:amidohydrolase family protein [Amycolatopsis jejuensis]